MRWGTDRQIIRALEKRLQWYMNESTHEEFNSKEVTAIVDLLQEMDPIEKRESDFFTAPKANGRFWAFHVFRKMYQRPDENAPVYPLDVRIEMRLRHFFRSNVVFNAAFILALIVAMILGGTTVIYGQQNGFFSKFDSQENMTITSPNSIGTDTVFQHEYQTMDQIPIQYVEYVWAPSVGTQQIDLQQIELTNNSKFIKSECLFKEDNSEVFAMYTRKCYKNKITTINQIFDSYTIYCKEIINDIDVDIYEKVNTDYTEYIATFIYDNSIYYINSNLDIDVIKEMIYNSIINSII